MIFRGTGLIWSPKDNKVILNMTKEGMFETTDNYIIDLLSKAANVVCIGDQPENTITAKFEESEKSVSEENQNYESLTKKELVQIAKNSGIKGSDRMSKDEIIEALS